MATNDDPLDDLRSVGMTSAAAATRVAETVLRASQDQARTQAQQRQEEAREHARRYEAQADAAGRFYDGTLREDWVTRAEPAEVVQAWKGSKAWTEIDADRFQPYAQRINESIKNTYGIDLDKAAERDGQDKAADAAEQAIAERQRADKERGAELQSREPQSSQAEAKEPGKDGAIAPEGVSRGGVQADGHAAEADAAESAAQGYDSQEARSQRDAGMRAGGVDDEIRDAVNTADHLNGTDPAKASAHAAKQGGSVRGPQKPPARQRSKSAVKGR